MSASRPKAPAFAWVVAWVAFALLYVPLVLLVISSFTAKGGGVTLDWYRRALSNPEIMKALGLSVWIGFWSMLVATVIGTAAALPIIRTRFPGRKVFDVVTHVPLIMPEIVLGLALLIWFVLLRITLGTFSVILAHVTFSVSYVIITVKSRLQDFDETLEEAARDLGADSWRTFRYVTFPLVWPAVLSGAILAFTLSFDDFLITFFTAGVGSDTLPVKIYAMIKFGVSPEISALSTLLLVATLGLLLLSRAGRLNARSPGKG